MKQPYTLSVGLCLVLTLPLSAAAQCANSTCPSGSITTLPSSGSIPAGTTWCITGPITSSTAFTVDGTLIIQSGTVNIGNLTVDKTGSVIVNGGARLNTGAFLGQNTTPASTISNLTVCNGGVLSMTGTISQGEINITVADKGILLADGSWSSIATDTYFKIGAGSLIEMCVSFTLNQDGFFTETSSSPSYLVTRGAVSQDNTGGWLSKSQGSSKISWSILGGPPAFLDYNSATACFSTACEPAGTVDNGICGSAANSYSTDIALPITFLDASAHSSASAFLITTDLSEAVPAADLILESSSDGTTFNPTTYTALASAGDHYSYTLPLQASNDYHRIHFLGDGASLYSIVLPPSGRQAAKSTYTAATIFNSTGQALRTVKLLPATPVWQFELPANLPAGIYFIRFSAPGSTPLTTRMIKTP